MNKNEYLSEDSDYLLSYNKVSGKKIKDLTGFISNEFGDPVFEIVNILFEDGTNESVGGEHDIAYIYSDDKINELLEELSDDDDEN